MITRDGTVYSGPPGPPPHPLRVAREGRNLTQEGLAERAGLSPETVRRAERGERVSAYSRHRLCKALGRPPEELGLVAARRGPWGAAGAGGSTRGPDVNRRDVFSLLSAAGASLVWPGRPPDPAGAPIDWPRLDGALATPARVDATVLRDCAALNAALWRAYTDAARPRAVLAPAQEQLGRLTDLLRGARTAAHHRRLAALVADAGQLVGLVLHFGHDLGAAAAGAYTLAAAAAQQAGAGGYDLWATALVRQAFVAVYDERPDRALPLLDAAARLARRGDGALSTRYWVAAVSADPLAALGDLRGWERALGDAEGVQGLTHGANGTWLRFDVPQLLEERGASAVTARRPDLAESALERALAYWPEPGQRRGLILTDLARAALQRREVDRAAAYGHDLIGVARLYGGVVASNLRVLDAELAPFADVPTVKALRTQLALVA